MDEFQVCVTFVGLPEVRDSGSRIGPNSAGDCVAGDCGALNPPATPPWSFVECKVADNAGFCFVEPG